MKPDFWFHFSQLRWFHKNVNMVSALVTTGDYNGMLREKREEDKRGGAIARQ